MLTVLVVLSLASYRITRFLIEDDLIETPRGWLKTKIYKPNPDTLKPASRLRIKLVDLLECPYCMSVWISAAAVALACWTWSVPQPFWSWLAVCGGAMVVWQIVED